MTTTSSSSGPEEETTTDLKQEVGDEAERARLLARPGETPPSGATAEAVSPGLQPLGLGSDRDGLLYVPEGYEPTDEAPLALTLHGSKGDFGAGATLQEAKDKAGVAHTELNTPTQPRGCLLSPSGLIVKSSAPVLTFFSLELLSLLPPGR